MAKDENKALYEARPWTEWYLNGVPPDVEIPGKSVVDTFDEATDRWKDKTALIFYTFVMARASLMRAVLPVPGWPVNRRTLFISPVEEPEPFSFPRASFGTADASRPQLFSSCTSLPR